MLSQQLAVKQKNMLNFQLMELYCSIREQTLRICDPLESEDLVVQPSSEVSPPKWHLAHTTWFFEEFLLAEFLPSYKRFDDRFSYIFNSYYKGVGPHWTQSERGHLSRPTTKDIIKYREHVDKNMLLLFSLNTNVLFHDLLEIGLHHEQQHQELLLMDIKYILGKSPFLPAYSDNTFSRINPSSNHWCLIDGDIYQIGQSNYQFAFDNEKPQHSVIIKPFAIQKNFVTNGEYLQFISEDSYDNPLIWHSSGWDWRKSKNISHPLYWTSIDGEWFEYTLYGLQKLNLTAPVCHVSFFEASAFANWCGVRLPTEQEYEVFLGYFSPNNRRRVSQLHCSQFINDLWGWTSSHYSPYPGYKNYSGHLGEYNKKFMCNQIVLKGGSFATPPGHYRNTYRNFYEAHQRWMFSGIRLAKDI